MIKQTKEHLTMYNNIVETFQISKNFGNQQQPAVSLVDLQIPAGAVFGLLGPNGAGKTTLLKMLIGLLRPTHGHVEMFGRPWQQSDLARIGALIETPAHYGHLTGPENLLVHTTLLGLP